MEPIIQIQNVSKSFVGKDNTVEALKGISLDIDKGQICGIIGMSGAGKSTLMKALLGLKKQSEGEIIMGDGLKTNEIGYLPQQTITQKDFPASVWKLWKP